jgi:hypothetical protein
MKRNSKVAAARWHRVATVRFEGPLEAVDTLGGMGASAAHQGEARRPDQLSGGGGGCNDDKKLPVAEARKSTMPLGTSSPKDEAVGEPRDVAEPTWKEGWTPSKPEEVSTPEQCGNATGEADHRRHRNVPLETKWRYVYRLLRVRSLKNGAMWHEGWKP